MNQTIAILVDAYRELNARKMFWISVILSGLFIGAFALFGADETKLSFLWFDWPMPMARTFYKVYLLKLALVTIWLTWAAVILALVSTASIFPDFIASGSIDLYLSRPIGRLRLFLTKYLAALLFVILQATIFSICAYFVVGIRAGEWKPSLFLAIPLITIFYSYLYSACVLLGMWTRSAIAALLLTILFWLLLFGLHFAEYGVLYMKLQLNASAAIQDQLVADADTELVEIRERKSVLNMFGTQESGVREKRELAVKKGKELRESAVSWNRWHDILFAAKTVLPKTSETVSLLDRKLFETDELASLDEEMRNQRRARRPRIGDNEMSLRMRAEREAQMGVQHEALTRSPVWVIGTSLAFEVVVLGIAAWVFCRRDY
ncbi:ABC transporter permease [Humisphaera borealis]|uniref:ABC transporter permease n=1 Tax=Humisphaera borealis TaxID=2807512 RepID=A0A7M2X3G1_9BACT|nr:ABC transporter permease subunit [Humisphaera borealis]QOV92215.1 ABC transporter permease [Humisphaera borealis]